MTASEKQTISSHLHNTLTAGCFNTSNQQQPLEGVDILVPVYNGYQALVKCCEALLEHTDPKHQIHLLNDASVDGRVSTYLDHLDRQWPQITVHHRPQNLGYLHNVNQQLKHSDSHVVLLNADTRVTAGWLEAMLDVASDSAIGAVCPLSDNATILTLNNHHSEMNSSAFNGLWYPIPTAVGSCMLIKQQVLNALGGFDPYYHPGYGEECDYSLRIRDLSLQVACAPAAFVYHQGSASFRKQASQLQHQHQQLLDLRWPGYSQEIAHFMHHNPATFIDALMHNQKHRRPAMLHVVHGLENKGGVEQFTRQLLLRFDPSLQHTVLTPHRLSQDLHEQLTEAGINVIVRLMPRGQANHIINQYPADPMNTAHDRWFTQLLKTAGFDGVHFHSLVGVGTLTWPLLCDQLDIPYWLFFHDHSGLCQIFSLSRNNGQQEVYCGKTHWQADDPDCLSCIRGKTQKSRLDTRPFMTLRSQLTRRMINLAAHVYFPGTYLQRLYTQQFRQLNNRSSVIEPCFYQDCSHPVKQLNKATLQLAFLGQFGSLKGAPTFLELCQQMAGEQVQWHIIGGTDPAYNQQLDQLGVKRHGSFETADLAKLLQPIDLVVFTGHIPETYGITLTESWLHGKPVVAPDLGAFSERVKPGVNGLLYPPGDLPALRQAIHDWVTLSQQPAADALISYRDTTPDKVTLLQDHYQQALNNKVRDQRSLPVTEDTPHLLGKPASSAVEQMQQWLDAPRTLEAEADWHTPPESLKCMITGADSTSAQLTKAQLAKALTHPVWLDNTTALADHPNAVVLLIGPGHNTNENLGNWLHYFSRSDHAISTADFALSNADGQPYAPQFAGRFSWQNHLTRHQAAGCVLIRASALIACVGHTPASQLSVPEVLASCHQNNPDAIIHFPHYVYNMPDISWVRLWKTSLANHQPVPASLEDAQISARHPSLKLLVIAESFLPDLQAQIWLNHIGQQSLISHANVRLVHLNQHNQSGLQELTSDPSLTHVLHVKDNIRCRFSNCLEKLLVSLLNSTLDVASVAAAHDQRGDYLLAQKQGGAPHFCAPGRLRDRRFDRPHQLWEHELIDEDCVLYAIESWRLVAQLIASDHTFYTAFKCSRLLQQSRFKSGVIEIRGLFKQGTPSLNLNAAMPSLAEQRQALIASGQHRIENSHHPKAFSTRGQSGLDLKLTAFKTPKRLPRVVAYAHDQWASGFYRITSPLTALAANNQISVHFLPIGSEQHLVTPHELYRFEPDVLFVQHVFSDARLAALQAWREQLDCRIVIDLDDLLTDIPAHNPFAKRSPADMEKRLRKAFSLADQVVVSTPYLATEFRAWHNNIQVIPNRLSSSIWPAECPVTENQTPRIGWAGAGQHQADLAWLSPVIEHTKDRVQWVFFGDQPELDDAGGIEFHAPVPLAEYPGKLQQLRLDAAIAPLINHPFNEAKSPLKLLEYGALGLPVVASDVAAYRDSPAVCLPNDTAAWIDQINQWVDDPAARVDAGRQLKAWVDQSYWLEQHLSEYRQALNLSDSS